MNIDDRRPTSKCVNFGKFQMAILTRVSTTRFMHARPLYFALTLQCHVYKLTSLFSVDTWRENGRLQNYFVRDGSYSLPIRYEEKRMRERESSSFGEIDEKRMTRRPSSSCISATVT